MKHARQVVRRHASSKAAARSTLPAREKGKRRLPPMQPAPVILPNVSDTLAIEKLRTAPAGELAIDHLVRCDPEMVPQLREAMIEVYRNAAQSRELRKATRPRLNKARSALISLKASIRHLESASTDGRDGITRALLGSPLDDEKGEREATAFSSTCSSIKLEIVPHAINLQSAIQTEIKKSSSTGERPKRLRSLVDALATWWLRGGGKSLAPYVKANRRDDGPAVVHGRSGRFHDLAIALFSGVDVFKRSEVEAAVTNVHEARLIEERTRR